MYENKFYTIYHRVTLFFRDVEFKTSLGEVELRRYAGDSDRLVGIFDSVF